MRFQSPLPGALQHRPPSGRVGLSGPGRAKLGVNRCRAFVLVFAFSASPVHAADPSLAFDFPRTIACQEIPSDDGRRLVRCVLPLSVQLLAGDAKAIEEVRVELADYDRRLRVAAFAPTTRLESSLAGNVERSETTETAKTFNASLGGEAPVLAGDFVAHVTPTVGGGYTARKVVTESQQRLPPKQVVVASGTTAEGHGVFFHLRRTPQTSLEGMHELSVEFEVPDNWRGDALFVSVAATGQDKFLWLTQRKVWEKRSAPVAVYLAGDAGAKQAARDVVER